MKITIFGTRGSYPVARKEVMRYGGNTTCLFIESGQDLITIDGGTGIVKLGQSLIAREHPQTELNLFLTHPHWDHILGLPAFQPLYDERFHITIFGSDSENKTVESIFSTQYTSGNFPVHFDQLPASIRINKIDRKSRVKLSSTNVTCCQLNHPGINLGYRFESPTGIFCVLHDLAPIEANYLGFGMASEAASKPKAFETNYNAGLVDFIRDADLVLYDTCFTDEELEGKRHWGHSTATEAFKILEQHRHPPALILSHHDPNHSDAMMDAIYDAAKREGKKRNIEVLVAKELGVFKI